MNQKRTHNTEMGGSMAPAESRRNLRKTIARWIIIVVVALVVPGGMLILLSGGLRQTLSHFSARSNDRSITRSTV